jgi:hypothetical protein
MKSLIATTRAFARPRTLPLLLAASSALCLLSSGLRPATLRAQDLPALPAPTLALPPLPMPSVKAAQKPKSDKWVFSVLPVGLQKNPQVDYAIFTEMTDEGRKLPEPSFANPVYYISHSMGQRDVGDAYGGTRPIPYKYLEQLLSNSLGANGYRPFDPARPENPPTQVLFFTWGMHNKIDTSLMMADDISDDGGGGDTGDGGDGGDSGGASLGPIAADMNGRANLLSRAKIIGGKRFASEYAQAMMEGRMAMRQFAERDELTETLVYAVQNECYYLLVTSMCAEALAHKEKKILWTTTISTVSQGVSFETTLPIMVNNVSYFLGRETTVAEIVRKRAYKRAEVNVGEATVVEFISGTAAKPASTGTAKP